MKIHGAQFRFINWTSFCWSWTAEQSDDVIQTELWSIWQHSLSPYCNSQLDTPWQLNQKLYEPFSSSVSLDQTNHSLILYWTSTNLENAGDYSPRCGSSPSGSYTSHSATRCYITSSVSGTSFKLHFLTQGFCLKSSRSPWWHHHDIIRVFFVFDASCFVINLSFEL